MNVVVGIVAFLFLWSFFSTMSALIVLLAWNCVVVPVFGVKAITFFMAFLISLVVGMLKTVVTTK